MTLLGLLSVLATTPRESMTLHSGTQPSAGDLNLQGSALRPCVGSHRSCHWDPEDSGYHEVPPARASRRIAAIP